MPKPEQKYLTQKPSGLWQFVWRVPDDCLDAFDGKRQIKQSLKTHSLREAKARRALVLAECMKRVQAARAAGAGDERALFAVQLRGMETVDHEHLSGAWSAVEDKEPTTSEDRAFKEALRVVYLGHDSELAKTTLKDALKVYREDRAGQVTEKTLGRAARSVKAFLDFLKKADTSVESINRTDVKGFIQASRATAKGKTISDWLTFLSAIFKTAQDHGKIPESKANPFAGHNVPRKDRQPYQRFTPAELRKVFDATQKYRENPAEYHRYLLPRLAYSTGCRIEELCSLQRAQVLKEGEIIFLAIAEGADSYKGKTINAARRIPVHSSLADEVLRWRDSDTHRLLFPELESNRADGKLGDKYGKSFGRLKTELKIPGGRYKGFHSFRVHMASNIEGCPQHIPEETAVWIMGHTRNLSLTYGLYSKGPSLDQLRDVVESAVGYGLKEELGGAW